MLYISVTALQMQIIHFISFTCRKFSDHVTDAAARLLVNFCLKMLLEKHFHDGIEYRFYYSIGCNITKGPKDFLNDL